MGCHKLKYYPVLDLVKNEYKKELTSNKSTHRGCSDYLYGFQGQEKDDEIKGAGNSINYKYRMHDPRLGRFFAVDPLTSEYPHYTPYSFSGNKVISWIELEGLEEKKPSNESVKPLIRLMDKKTIIKEMERIHYAKPPTDPKNPNPTPDEWREYNKEIEKYNEDIQFYNGVIEYGTSEESEGIDKLEMKSLKISPMPEEQIKEMEKIDLEMKKLDEEFKKEMEEYLKKQNEELPEEEIFVDGSSDNENNDSKTAEDG